MINAINRKVSGLLLQISLAGRTIARNENQDFKAEFKVFGELENAVSFGDSDDPRPILAKAPEIKGTNVALFEGNKDSSCVTAKQLFDHVKKLQGCDEFELVVIPLLARVHILSRLSPNALSRASFIWIATQMFCDSCRSAPTIST